MINTPLSEDDFRTTTPSGSEIEAIFVGEESEYVIAYGHVDHNEMLELAREVIISIGEEPDGDLYSLDDDTDIDWVWAVKKTPDYIDEWEITWSNIDESTPNSFPITVLTLW